MTTAIDDCGATVTHIARRFAPPRLTATQPDVPPADELVLVRRALGQAIRVIAYLLQIGAGVICARLRTWVDAHIVHSLHAAWSIGLIGWGGFIGLTIFEIFLRWSHVLAR